MPSAKVAPASSYRSPPSSSSRRREKERKSSERPLHRSSAAWATRCLKRTKGKHCYIALLLGSVIANVVQLLAFFLNQPDGQHLPVLHHARTSYRKLFGHLASTFSSTASDSAAARSTALEASLGGTVGTVGAAGAATTAKTPPRPHDGPLADGHLRTHAAVIVPPPPPPPPLPPRHQPTRHPQYRIAFTVPWIGKTFPSWFPYFLSSCGRSNFIADWLIFHEGAKMPLPEEVPPNVLFYDLGKNGLGVLFGTKLAKALGVADEAPKYVQLFQTAFREFAYIVTEYKPTHGVVFAEYLQRYSHWSYTDIDMLIGDLPLFIDHEELSAYDIFTYHFGDAFRLYLRGQFAAHRNAPEINMLWAECPHLGAGLAHELEAKHEIVRRLASEGKHGRTRFISAEGCYSWVVASKPWMRVKFASKAFADWSDDKEFYVIDGAVRKCPLPSLVWEPPPGAEHGGGAPAHHHHAAAGHGRCDPFGPRIAAHSIEMRGVQTADAAARGIELHRQCSRWVEERYRLCADLTEEESPSYNVVLRNGTWSAHTFTTRGPAAKFLEGAFLHLQQWKGEYKRLSYGHQGMQRLEGRTMFKLGRFGVSAYDGGYRDAEGAEMGDVVASARRMTAKDITEMSDEEFDEQLVQLKKAVQDTGHKKGKHGHHHID